MRLLFIILFFIPSFLDAQYSIDRVYYDVDNSDTLYIKSGTDSLFRKVGENYEYAMKTWFKEFVQPTNVIGGSTNPHWDSIQGKPATFAPSVHSHAISGVTNLQTTLDGKLATNGDGSLLIGLTKTQVGLANVDNTSDANKPVSSATQTALNLKANLASPTFTGTVSGITSAMVGLGNVNNTSDAAKPISTATQTALDGKLATNGNGSSLTGLTKGQVGLANVDNTSDAAKPVSTATQTALNLKADLAARVNTVASTASLTINSDVTDVYTVTALAAAMTINNPSGTPANGQKLIIRIKDNGVARQLTWSGSEFRAGDIAFPTTTIPGKQMYVGLMRNQDDLKWDLLALIENL
jgi:hypothetical protein